MHNLLALFLQKAPSTSGGGLDFSTIVMFLAIGVVFYLFLIRPQQRKQKEEKAFRENLKKGDKVITIGGIIGKIVEIEETNILVEVDNGVKIKFEKSAIRQAAA